MPDSEGDRAARNKRAQFMCSSREFMAMACRLFVNGFSTEGLLKTDLLPLFDELGKVYDLSIHKGYVFVQYDNLDSATAAIDKLNGRPFKGGKIMAKLAHKDKAEQVERDSKKGPASAAAPPGGNAKDLCKYFQFGKCMRGDSCFYRHEKADEAPRSAPPLRDRRSPPPRDRRGDDRKLFQSDARERPPPPRPLPPRDYPPHDLPLRERPLKRPYPDELDDGDRYRGRVDPFIPAAPPVRSAGLPVPAPRPAPAPNPVDLRPPFDCVIITGNELQRHYCELIDKKVKDFGMLTSIQVVDGEHLLKRAVEEAARHTVPYTISVTANNEEHRSLTLNILHGVAQEHRNMPLDDAMPFLSRNFDQFVEMMKKKISAVKEWIPPDGKVAYLLNLLADGRQLVVEELEDIKKFVDGAIVRMSPAVAPTIPQPVKRIEPEPNGLPKSHDRDRDHRDHHRRTPEHVEKGDRSDRGSLLPPPKKADLPPPSRHRGDRYQDSSPRSGTMIDLMNQKLSERKDHGSYESMRGYHGLSVGASSSTSASGIDFDDPSVKQALDDLLNINARGNSRASDAHKYGY